MSKNNETIQDKTSVTNVRILNADASLKEAQIEQLVLRNKIDKEILDRDRKNNDRYAIECRMREARSNIDSLSNLYYRIPEIGNGLLDILETNIKVLSEISHMEKGGSGIASLEINDLGHLTDDLGHLTSSGLKSALANTDVLSVINRARRNGWSITISGNSIKTKKLKNLKKVKENKTQKLFDKTRRR
ncbi:MAG: hypothetical protein WC375_09435 [Methanomassiliicoccales archaeon]|jgi:hypothetical protein